MEGSEELTGLVSVLTSVDLWQAIFVFIVGFVIAAIIKNIATNIFNFILIHVEFGIGSHIEYKGIRGIIITMHLSRTIIRLDDEDSYMYIRNTDRKLMLLITPDKQPKIISKDKE